jgi:ATP-dependent RNA helicase RhlE
MPFTQFNLNPKLLQAVGDLDFTTPTPIQKLAIPPLMEGRDVMGTAATGSGKTAAFLLPILHSLMQKPRGKTRTLVLAPTRELAAQIVEHCDALAAHTSIKAAAVYGGVGMEPQVRAFERGVDLIVACPGRLLDHFQYPYARLESLEYLVLDEADRMLDMGFLPDVRRILRALPVKRQTMLFSATMPQPIVQLANEMLKAPVALNIERKAAPAAGIRHAVFPVPEELKKHLLLRLLKRPEAGSVLAFTRTKHRANRLADFLAKNGVACERIHGNRTQMQRTDALKGFKSGRHQVLVATDIAARGIDVEALGIVVNFDVPHVPNDYIHRSGRTARAELTGDAYTLVSPAEESDLRAIERHIGKSFPRQKVEGFDYSHKPAERFEVPLAERIAAIRSRKSEERARAKAKAEAKAHRERESVNRPAFLREPRTPAPSHQRRPAAAAHSYPPKPPAHSHDMPHPSPSQDQSNLRGGFYSKVARPTAPSHSSRRSYPSRPPQPAHTDPNRKRKPPAPFRDSIKNRGSK